MATDNSSPEKRIYEQIELDADYYPPSIYTLLTQYARINLDRDIDSDDFIPLSPVALSGRNPKIFAVGVMPPSSNVTGRLSDRSETVSRANLASSAPETASPSAPGTSASGGEILTKPPAKSNKDPIITAAGYQLRPPVGSASGLAAVGTPPGPDMGAPTISKLTIPQVWGVLYQAYTEMNGHPPSMQEMQFYTAQCWRETGGSLPNNNFGFTGNYEHPKSGTFLWGDKHYYDTQPTLVAGAKHYLGFVRDPNIVQSAQEGDALGFMTGLAQNGYYTAAIDEYYGGPGKYYGVYPRILAEVSQSMKPFGVDLDNASGLPRVAPDSCAFHETQIDYRARLAKAGVALVPGNAYRLQRGSPYDASCPLNPAGSQSNWQQGGSDNAVSAQKSIDESAGKPLLKQDLADRLTAAQKAMINATQLALDVMAITPPLRMLVNPSSFKVASEKVISDGSYGRYGPIVEHWGDNQDKIDASGKVAGFWAQDVSGKSQGAGLTRTARNASQAYQNFLSLYLLYRNNGAMWLGGPGQQELGLQQETLSVLGSIYIYYDNTLYIGSFDTFSISESDDKPFSLDYSFGFTVRATFPLDNVDSVIVNGHQVNPFANTATTGSDVNPTLGTTPRYDLTTNPTLATISSVQLPPLPGGIAAEAQATEGTLGFGTGAVSAPSTPTSFETSGRPAGWALTPPKTGKGSK